MPSLVVLRDSFRRTVLFDNLKRAGLFLMPLDGATKLRRKITLLFASSFLLLFVSILINDSRNIRPIIL